MKTLDDPAVLEGLVARLAAVRPDARGLWGKMTAGEMLCHLGDAVDGVLGRPPDEDAANKRFIKLLALKSPLAWPRNLPTPARVDPKKDGSKPGDFEADRQRAIDGLRRFAAAPASELRASHGAFGAMTRRDWSRWAYRHTDHHLKQFGV